MYPFFTFGSITVPSYGVMMMLGVLVASTIGLLRVRRAGLVVENAIIILACAFGFALLGATGLYIAVSYSWSELMEMLRDGTLFTENRLGLVFYGGLLAAIPGAFVGQRIAGARLRDYVPAMLPCIPLGHAFGRIGCLLGGCCYGRPTNLPIGVVYNNPISDAPQGIALFPVQALESLILLAIFVVLILYTRAGRPPRRIVGLYFMLYAVCRMCMEYLRYDAVRGHIGFWSTSQWISAFLFLLGAFLWMHRARADAGERRQANGADRAA